MASERVVSDAIDMMAALGLQRTDGVLAGWLVALRPYHDNEITNVMSRYLRTEETRPVPAKFIRLLDEMRNEKGEPFDGIAVKEVVRYSEEKGVFPELFGIVARVTGKTPWGGFRGEYVDRVKKEIDELYKSSVGAEP